MSTYKDKAKEIVDRAIETAHRRGEDGIPLIALTNLISRTTNTLNRLHERELIEARLDELKRGKIQSFFPATTIHRPNRRITTLEEELKALRGKDTQ